MNTGALQRPNIILIMTDQQRYDTIAELGYSHVITPHLDRLAKEGVSFTHCYCNSPSCAPSRASLFTGLFPHSSGVLQNNHNWPRTWVQDLRDSGYYCVNVGKMHCDPYGELHGFHERFVVENKQRRLAEPLWSGNPHVFDDEWDKALAVRGFERPEKTEYLAMPDAEERQGCYEWELPEDLHPDVFTGDLALRWIDRAPLVSDEPIFLQIGFPGPHPPFDPIPRYVEPYLNRDLPMLPADREEIEGQPATLQALRDRLIARKADSIVFDPYAAPEQRHRQRACYLANITMIDEQVGRILERLEKRGMLDNSVVFFTSDHGESLGDHGLIEKWNMYEESVRVPLLVWAPERFAGGRRVETLMQLFDIGPTILELAGLTPPKYMQAASLCPMLEGDEESSGGDRPYAFSEHAADFMLQNVGHLMMVRDNRYKLIDYHGTGEGQLFDLQVDPQERFNLWDDPGHREKRDELSKVLFDWFVSGTLRAAGWWKKPEAGRKPR